MTTPNARSAPSNSCSRRSAPRNALRSQFGLRRLPPLLGCRDSPTRRCRVFGAPLVFVVRSFRTAALETRKSTPASQSPVTISSVRDHEGDNYDHAPCHRRHVGRPALYTCPLTWRDRSDALPRQPYIVRFAERLLLHRRSRYRPGHLQSTTDQLTCSTVMRRSSQLVTAIALSRHHALICAPSRRQAWRRRRTGKRSTSWRRWPGRRSRRTRRQRHVHAASCCATWPGPPRRAGASVESWRDHSHGCVAR